MAQPVEITGESIPKCDGPASASGPSEVEKQDLPKLTAQEFRVYNSMAEHMNYYVCTTFYKPGIGQELTIQQHENFRQTWNILYGACSSGKRPSGMSIRAFLNMSGQFCHHLTIHHTIEEQHIFPVLARKMPKFQKELHLLTQHKQIHNGLDKFEDYVEKCKTGEREVRLDEMKDIMESFGEVLWQHLDDEVKELGADNMRKYWTMDEMRRMPM